MTEKSNMKESRQSERTAHDAPKQGKAPGKSGEYTVDEMRRFLEEMSGKYDLARVVDPIECRILDFQNDGRIGMNERCYGIWNAEQKCVNCSSALACRTGCHQEKAERFQDEVYFIQSNPVSLKLADGSVFDAVVELVNIEKDSTREANDREAENIGGRAAGYLAQHDSLTNVLNAEAFYELGRTRIQNSPERAWVMVTGNIMNFRLVNNLFGVARGNEVLVRTAAMLREISENARGLCGRLGGDQFAMLLPGSRFREENLLDTARSLGEVFNSGLFSFCIHFGVYRVEDSAIPVSVMCGRANSALRTIREDLTRTIAVFDDEILKRDLQEQKVIGGFEEALQGGQFRMYLQPLRHRDRRGGAGTLVPAGRHGHAAGELYRNPRERRPDPAPGHAYLGACRETAAGLEGDRAGKALDLGQHVGEGLLQHRCVRGADRPRRPLRG